MANENQKTIQSGKIKTMQHDLDRVKNPSPGQSEQSRLENLKAATTTESSDVTLDISSAQDASASEGILNSSDTETPQKDVSELQDPKLEQLFVEPEPSSPEETLSTKDTPIDLAQAVGLATPDSPELDAPKDIASAVSSLRSELPQVDEEKIKEEISQPSMPDLAQLKGFDLDMDSSEDINSAAVGSSAVNINVQKTNTLSDKQSGDKSFTPPTSAPKNPYSRIDDIRKKESGTPQSNATTTSGSVMSTSSGSKKPILGILAVLLLVVVFGGGYWYFMMGSDTDTSVNQDQQDISSEESPDEITSNEIENLVDPLQPDTVIEVTPTANVKADLVTALSAQTGENELVEIDILDDSNAKVDIEEIESLFSVLFPTEIKNSLQDYMLVGVLDSGSYELGLVLELQDNVAESFLQTWQNTVIQDLSSFRLSQQTPTVSSDASLQSVEKIQISTGETFVNYFYNYSLVNTSTDISAKENIILIGTTQNTMEYLIQNVFIQ